MKKNILITSVHMDIGGIESVLLSLLSNIDYTKFNVDLILYKKQGINLDKVPDKVNVYSPYSYSGKKLLNKITRQDKFINKVIRKLTFNKFTEKNFISNKKYDVGIAFAGYHQLMDNFVNLSNCKKRYIWIHTDVKWLIDNDIMYKNDFYKNCNKYYDFDKIIAVSKSVMESFCKVMPRCKNKVTYIYNLLNFKISDEKIHLSNKYNIVSVGRLAYQKGFDRLIDVVDLLRKENKNFFVSIIGDGDEKNKLVEKVNKLEINDYIQFLGKSNNVSAYLNSADLFVLTSYSEGAGLVLIEALASHLPIVVPNVTGIKDIKIIAPDNSYILTDNNIEAIKNGVVDAMNGKICKDFKFNLNNYNKKILKQYEKVLSGDL